MRDMSEKGVPGDNALAASGGEVVVYEAPDGEVCVDVRLDQDTVWLTQAQMVELFGRDQSVISRHLRNVFAEKELPEESNMQKVHITSSDKPVAFYNLDVIISVGYRVKSNPVPSPPCATRCCPSSSAANCG